MPRLIIDSSVAIKWFVPEPYSVEATRILDEYKAGNYDFLVPDLMYAEFGNIIWRKQRYEGLPAIDADQILQLFQLMRFETTPNARLLEDAYKIAVAYNQTVYDSLYVALSDRESCQFVTADEKLYKAIQTQYPLVIWIGNWNLP
jgi:predicted nucleic acid-binding protein